MTRPYILHDRLGLGGSTGGPNGRPTGRFPPPRRSAADQCLFFCGDLRKHFREERVVCRVEGSAQKYEDTMLLATATQVPLGQKLVYASQPTRHRGASNQVDYCMLVHILRGFLPCEMGGSNFQVYLLTISHL
jgi:hypothetical protein